jgi:hypothetical protein
MIHYVTSEIAEITDDGSTITLKTAQDEFFAEITLQGYRCEQSSTIKQDDGIQRIKLHGKEGVIMLRKAD